MLLLDPQEVIRSVSWPNIYFKTILVASPPTTDNNVDTFENSTHDTPGSELLLELASR
jgi:hypothetical protein